MIRNAAFEFLRQHKEVEQSTEDLVIKKLKGRYSQDELLTIFENGISGQYGKVYSCSPDTLMGWINKYQADKNSNENYLESPLYDVNADPKESWDWAKETNKCYHAFLKGVSSEYFHPCVYDNLILENRVEVNAYRKYYKVPEDANPDNSQEWIGILREVAKAKQKVIADVFNRYKSYGYKDIFALQKTV